MNIGNASSYNSPSLGIPNATPSTVGIPGTVPGTTSHSGQPSSTKILDSTGMVDPEVQYEAIQNEQKILDDIKQIELIPLLLDLIENLKIGKISPKDFDNAVGRIRVRVSRMKNLLNNIEGLDESSDNRIRKMEELKLKIDGKREVLMNFKEVVEKFEYTNTNGSNDNDITHKEEEQDTKIASEAATAGYGVSQGTDDIMQID
ncbi:unnamed protein product [[Candida] boidinii]|uniref:Mediator of RNA polymerase II transcription subunit 9 n=1 Tax=Candida boidinii TaxID=5477 RepID=A0A9W6W7C6_CANBO|nr:unnamed protein product [[Candida] boidinii]GMG00317.1 unnamed protein product [[Candida] boidinii]